MKIRTGNAEINGKLMQTLQEVSNVSSGYKDDNAKDGNDDEKKNRNQEHLK